MTFVMVLYYSTYRTDNISPLCTFILNIRVRKKKTIMYLVCMYSRHCIHNRTLGFGRL